MKLAMVVKEWPQIPQRIQRGNEDLKPTELLIRGGPEGWSIAEYVHHLVEANLIASQVVLNAIGKAGATYDWSWVTPNTEWMRRLGYDHAPIAPALDLLESLAQYMSCLLAQNPRGLRRTIAILDSLGGVPEEYCGKDFT